MAGVPQRRHDRFGSIFGRLEVRLDAEGGQPLGRHRPHRAELHALQVPHVARAGLQAPHEGVHGVGAGEHHPVERGRVRDGAIERAVVFRRHDADHGRFDGLRAERLEQVHQLAGLLARPRHDDALAEERPLVEPAQVLPERGHAAHHENRGLVLQALRFRQLLQRAVNRVLRRQRPVVHDGGRLVLREAVREQRLQDFRQLLRAGVADHRAAQHGQRLPVDLRRGGALVFMAADERHGVAALGIRDGNARVARRADGRGDAGHHLEHHALLVQEQRFLAAAVEDERVAPFQPRHHFAFARLFHKEVADRFLIERLRRGGADVDLLGVLPRVAQHARRHEVVVEHHVRVGERAQAPHGDQAGIAGPCADEIHNWTHKNSG